MKKKNSLSILDTGTNSAAENMRLDEELLYSLDESGGPILHLYEWEEPSITHGYFRDPNVELDLNSVALRGLSLARRPTGGGILFHLWDYAFSFLMPARHPQFCSHPLDNYRFVNRCVAEAVRPFLDQSVHVLDCCEGGGSAFCMARPTIYDLVVDGKKVAGAAQRKRKNGYLHQGSISLVVPDGTLLEQVLKNRETVEAIKTCSFSVKGVKLESLRLMTKERLIAIFQGVCN